MSHLSDLEVKVMDFENSFLLVLVAKHNSGELHCPMAALIFVWG